MASGFFGGGFASGFDSGFSTVDNAIYKHGLLDLENKRMQQDQKNKQRSEFMQLRSDGIAHLQETMQQLRIAHPDWTDQQLASNPAVVSLKNMLGGFDKNLGLSDTIDSIVANFAARPSAAVTEAALARAKEGPLGQEVKLSEINKNRSIAGQPPIDVSGKPVSQTNPDLDTETQLGGKTFKSTGNPQTDSILKGIDNGDIPPDLKGLYGKNKTGVLAGAENNGINIAQKQLQWEQARKQVQSLNGPQMTRYAGLNTSVINTINEVNAIAKEMSLSGIPLLNKAQLTKLIETEGNSPKGQLAARYIAVVGTLKEEFANLANGGYAPTEPAWALANRQVNENYGVKELGASLGEIQKLLKIRVNAIPGFNTLGPGAANQYTGNKGNQDSQSGTVNGVRYSIEP